MRKEVIFAVIFGIILGGVILYGLKIANTSTQNLPKNDNVTTQQETTPNREKGLLEIEYPLPNYAFTTDTITLKGSATPKTSIAVVTEESDFFIESDEEGNFETKIKLVGGENTISLSLADQNQELQTKDITLFYSSSLD